MVDASLGRRREGEGSRVAPPPPPERTSLSAWPSGGQGCHGEQVKESLGTGEKVWLFLCGLCVDLHFLLSYYRADDLSVVARIIRELLFARGLCELKVSH